MADGSCREKFFPSCLQACAYALRNSGYTDYMVYLDASFENTVYGLEICTTNRLITSLTFLQIRLIRSSSSS